MSVNSGFKVTKFAGGGDRKIMQSIRITSRPPSISKKEEEPDEPVLRKTSTKVIPIEKT